jgi:hypothetical protein
VIGANANQSVATRDFTATFPVATAGADDAPVQRRFLQTLVHQFDYQAVTVENGEAARPSGLKTPSLLSFLRKAQRLCLEGA